jgi:hypothetical protein
MGTAFDEKLNQVSNMDESGDEEPALDDDFEFGTRLR